MMTIYCSTCGLRYYYMVSALLLRNSNPIISVSATIKSSFVFRLNIISSKLDDINQKKHKPPVLALHISQHKVIWLCTGHSELKRGLSSAIRTPNRIGVMWGKEAIAFAMRQGSEAWELAHISLTQLTHNYEVVAPFHTTHNHTNTKKG